MNTGNGRPDTFEMCPKAFNYLLEKNLDDKFFDEVGHPEK